VARRSLAEHPADPLAAPPPCAPAAAWLAAGTSAPRCDLEEMERTLIENALRRPATTDPKRPGCSAERSKLYTRMERFGLA